MSDLSGLFPSQVTKEAKRVVESLMVDTCRIEREAAGPGTTNYTTFATEITRTEIYSGKCMMGDRVEGAAHDRWLRGQRPGDGVRRPHPQRAAPSPLPRQQRPGPSRGPVPHDHGWRRCTSRHLPDHRGRDRHPQVVQRLSHGPLRPRRHSFMSFFFDIIGAAETVSSLNALSVAAPGKVGRAVRGVAERAERSVAELAPVDTGDYQGDVSHVIEFSATSVRARVAPDARKVGASSSTSRAQTRGAERSTTRRFRSPTSARWPTSGRRGSRPSLAGGSHELDRPDQ